MSKTSSSRGRPSASRPKPVQKKPVPKKLVRKKPVPEKPVRQTPRQRELTTKRRGELAELAFVLKAANLGFGVSRPYGDSERYDVIVDARNVRVGRALLPAAFDVPAAFADKDENRKRNGKRDRKTTSLRKQTAPNPATLPPDASPLLWRVQVKCSTQLLDGLYRVNAHRRSNGRAVPYLPGEIDFFATYIIPEDTWYIIPLHATRGATGLLFRRRRDRRPGRYDAYREAWHLLRPE
jgi:hypothetical protein